jgi:hypothetical protein
MLKNDQVEELITVIAGLDRRDLVEQFRTYQGSFPVDFTADFLERQSVERLRHILAALCIQQKRIPRI